MPKSTTSSSSSSSIPTSTDFRLSGRVLASQESHTSSSTQATCSTDDTPLSATASLQMAFLAVDIIPTPEGKVHILEWDRAERRNAFTPRDTSDAVIKSLETMPVLMLKALLADPRLDEVIFILPCQTRLSLCFKLRPIGINRWLSMQLTPISSPPAITKLSCIGL